MSRKSRLLVTNITYIPVVNPEIITGISLMLLFVAYQRFATQSAWLPDNIMGLPTLLIAHIAFNVPYVIFNVSPKLKQLDIKLYEAALDLGCDPRQAFFKVILPEISPAILSAFLICLTYSIDDFMISYFNCGTVETLPIAIYSMTRKKVSPEIYALSTISSWSSSASFWCPMPWRAAATAGIRKRCERRAHDETHCCITADAGCGAVRRIAGVCRRYHRGDRGCLGVG